MDQILDRLWLGDVQDGKRAAAPLTAVLNLCTYAYNNPAVVVVHAPLVDEVCLPPPEWQSRIHALQHLLGQGHTVLVHCRLGKSRSPALVAAYLTSTGWNLAEAIVIVMDRRPLVRIHPTTLRSVRFWWDWSQRRLSSPSRDGMPTITESLTHVS